MARSPLIELLDSAIRLPERASPADEADVRRRIALTLPPGVPDYVAAVIRVERHDGDRVMAELLVFDAQPMTIEIRGDASDGSFMMLRWHAQDGDVPFGWDPKARSWRRMPEADPDLGPDPAARWDTHEAKEAEKREKRRLKREQAAAARAEAKAAAKAKGVPVKPVPVEFADGIWW